jgi:hypothetical protein
MRRECRHYESRSYANGDAVQKCNLDLAPDAPWRCPDACVSFERRPDGGWTYGSIAIPSAPNEPPGLDDGSAAAVLDAAEDHLNSVGAQVMAEIDAERSPSRESWIRRVRRRRRPR